jgi:hypothetical protein
LKKVLLWLQVQELLRRRRVSSLISFVLALFNVKKKKKKKKKKKRGEANDLKFYTAHGFVVVCKSHLILSRVERVEG